MESNEQKELTSKTKSLTDGEQADSCWCRGVVGLGWWVEGLSKKEKEKKTYGHRQQYSDWQGGGER